MASIHEGRSTIDYLIERGRLEHVAVESALASAKAVIGRASRRLLTAEGGLRAGDVEGAFVAAYEAYRMAAEALLLSQGLRATGGEGGHVTVEDAVDAQFGQRVRELAKPTFERLRRTRHAAQYFDPSSAEIDEADSTWAIATARSVVEQVSEILSSDPPGRYR